MENYTEGTFQDVLLRKGIDSTQLMNEVGFEPRLCIKYMNGTEEIIEGDVKIAEFIESLKQTTVK